MDLKYADEWYWKEGMYHRPQRSFAIDKNGLRRMGCEYRRGEGGGIDLIWTG